MIDVGLVSELESVKKDANVLVGRCKTRMTSIDSQMRSSLDGAAASDKKHSFTTHLLKSKKVHDCCDAATASRVGSIDGEVRVHCTAQVHARAWTSQEVL